MNAIVCNYAPIRFLPYRELGEFVTIGIVIHCPQIGFFGYQLVSPKKTARIAGFFPELNTKIFKAAIQGTERELSRLESYYRSVVEHPLISGIGSVERQVARFQELIRKREGLVYFGEPGSRIAHDPKMALQELFDYFVNRQFAQKKEYQETIMRQRLGQLLRDWNLSRYYNHHEIVGDDDFHLNMPFVHKRNGQIVKVIKPLDLRKNESTEIYQHGGTWVKNMERLHRRGLLPQSTVFTIQFPDASSGKVKIAADEISAELTQIGIDAVDFSDVVRIRSAVSIG